MAAAQHIADVKRMLEEAMRDENNKVNGADERARLLREYLIAVMTGEATAEATAEAIAEARAEARASTNNGIFRKRRKWHPQYDDE